MFWNSELYVDTSNCFRILIDALFVNYANYAYYDAIYCSMPYLSFHQGYVLWIF